LVRNAEKLSGYYEMPMAIVVRIVTTLMTVVVRVVNVATTIAVPMFLLVMTVPMAFLGTLFIRRASFDMDMGNVVSRVAVPQGGAKRRYGSRIEQQYIRGIESTECSLPTKDLLLERSHLRLSNDCQADVGGAADSPEPTKPGDANATTGATDTRTVSG
jgi:hypothetical protein